jgi:endonuclease-8
MPEGNQIHLFAERHAAAFAGKKVRSDSPNGGFPDAGVLDGRVLRSVGAVGKHLGYVFGPDLIVHVHLGMYGDFWEGHGPPPEVKGALRWRVWMKTDWLELRGAMDCSLFDAAEWSELLARLGPDPLKANADPEPAFALIEKSKSAIGLLLMDQRVFSGIGNKFRAELLYRARVNPYRAGKEVSRAALAGIWKDAKTLMRTAMKDLRIVTTKLKDRPHPRGVALDDEVHYVYKRHGKPCFVCGATIKRAEMGGRTVYWCPNCQKS